ncbi:MAG: hypothetical protein Q8O76_08790, partial [Chloroflexota bacterium]|nr:hypothetical protein [Chloroflexota bacterium]
CTQYPASLEVGGGKNPTTDMRRQHPARGQEGATNASRGDSPRRDGVVSEESAPYLAGTYMRSADDAGPDLCGEDSLGSNMRCTDLAGRYDTGEHRAISEKPRAYLP